MLRGAIDPKEPPVYEYVRFIGNFKSLNNGMALGRHTNCKTCSILKLKEQNFMLINSTHLVWFV